jgi:hypothetical protein
VAGDSRPPPAPTKRSVRIYRTTLLRLDSQYGDSLQVPVREIQLWSKEWELFFDALELLPPDPIPKLG